MPTAEEREMSKSEFDNLAQMALASASSPKREPSVNSRGEAFTPNDTRKQFSFGARFKPTDIASVVLGAITIKNCVVRSVCFYEGKVFYDMLAPISDTGWVEINHVDSAVVTFN